MSAPPSTNRFAAKAKKPFSWSYSRLKNFETCGRRYEQIDVLKNFVEVQEEGGPLDYGNKLHSALGLAIRLGEPVAEPFAEFNDVVSRFRPTQEGDAVYAELKLAITQDLQPCDFFGTGAWYRGAVDVLKIRGDVAILVDWKTGKPVHDSVQLALNSALVFAHYPEIKRVATLYYWTKDKNETAEQFSRSDMDDLWSAMAPRVQALEQAYNSGQYLPVRNGLCRLYCRVTSCEYNGL